ncbi:MAG: hypothetical protein R2732_07505 [Microbacteriaceae bacterium]
MRAMRWLLVTASLALAAVATSGCAASAPPEQPAPAPLFASDEEAFAAAEATYRAYEDASNAIDLAAPGTFEAAVDFTVGEFNALEREGFSRLHSEGITKLGETRVVYVKPQQLAKDHSTIELAVCSDVSALDLIDAKGASTVNPARMDVQPFTVFLERSSSSPTGWLINGVSAHSGVPGCGS